MYKWSKKYYSCGNCNSTRFRHIAKGYCNRCCPLIRKLNIANGWDFNKKNTLKGFPFIDIVRDLKKCEKIKKNYIAQIKGHLACLKNREEYLTSEIYGIDIEYQLNRIASSVKGN